ncbi:MAG: aromatic ring-hydroxylating oxygenase subunit alpha [Ostreibacterium sp.]
MIDPPYLRKLLDRRVRGNSLEADFYNDQNILDLELKAIFEHEWMFAGNSSEIPNAGDYLTTMIGKTGVIVTRTEEGVLRAYQNSCRHRGSIVCLEAKGHANKFVCPYHQWTYGLDGSLLHAGEMNKNFDPASHSLIPVNLELMAGLIYVCIADNPPDFSNFRHQVEPYITPHQPDNCKVAFEMSIIENANWKLVVENNRECYHCAAAHPELTFSLTSFALPDDPRSNDFFSELMPRKAKDWDALGLPHKPVDGGQKFRCIRLPFVNEALSMTLDGSLASRKLLGDFEDPDLGSVRMFHVPHNWNHFSSDYILHTTVNPISPDKTLLTTKWLVHKDAVEGWDYDIEHLTAVWKATNSQDATLAENNHRGTRAQGYRTGPYSESEFMLVDFTNWYADKMDEYLTQNESSNSSANPVSSVRP